MFLIEIVFELDMCMLEEVYVYLEKLKLII